ncbi:alpha/beta hydrolase [Rubinisphaera italica]|uniref:Carboxylesterase n=1 Tax=Rubinisphaera italica TaxID=2527969 RepID=A0A5C5XCQ7_9PLAN|nr:alpha/beta hydrolase [Rubinisphaera italica]TWT60760.1 Carboxylesterase [Rubinisphaera italica]
MKTLLILMLWASVATATEFQVDRDINYAGTENRQQTLDLYRPSTGQKHPVMIWIHGGGWRAGDKGSVQHKPQAFVDRGFVFVSVGYRLIPDVTLDQMTGDIALAIHWVHEHAEQYKIDTTKVFVAGHSAGAHLAALVCTDSTYLKAAGLSLGDIIGCIPVDTAVYDAHKQISDQSPVRSALYRAAFGNDEQSQRRFSPITHVAQGQGIPPFLILHVASRPDSTQQSQEFANSLKTAGIHAELHAALGKDHGSINRDLGLRDDVPTNVIFNFLDRQLKVEE